MSRPSTLDELAREVADRIGRPVDVDAVAATIETLGVREADAREVFACPDRFALAAQVAPLVERLAPPEATEPLPPPLARAVVGAARFLRFYSRGVFFALPMIVQVVTITFLRLGRYMHLSEADATAMMFGSILSFLATGGFVQSVGRLGSVYVGRGNHRLAARLTYRILGFGMLAAVALDLAVLALSAVVEVMPRRGIAVALIYELLLSALWLSLAVLYMLQAQVLVFVCVSVWVGSFAALLALADAGIYAAQWGSAGVGIVASALVGWWKLRGLVRKTPPELAAEPLPPAIELIYEVRPYFAYGVLYFAFVFLDRVVGWTKAPPEHYALFFRTEYELGLDWALLTLVLTVALLDHTINAFATSIGPTQRRYRAADVAGHNRSFQLFYVRQLLLLAALVALASVGVYFGGMWLKGAAPSVQEIQIFFAQTETYRVFAWAAIGYGLLVWGLLNAVFFFVVSRPMYALRPLGLALVAGAAAGLAFSRSGAYWESVVGLGVGALVFALGTTAAVARVLGELDFYYYASY